MLRSFFCWLSAACLLAGTAAAKTPGLAYLSEMNDPVAAGAGDVAALPGFGTGPASLPDGSLGEWSLSRIRTPETRALILADDALGGQTTVGELIREGYLLQTARRSFGFGAGTRLSAEIAFRGEGDFTRVNHEGTSIHAYPTTDWSLGVGAAQRFGERLSVGTAARWLRSKYAETENEESVGRFGNGWAFDVGVDYRVAEKWRVGVSARNLSAGVSYPNPDLPRDPRHEVIVGGARAIPLSKTAALDLAGDLRFPSRRGVQFSSGATLRWRERVGVSAGYQRRVERWTAARVDPASGAVASDERLWAQRGPTVGAWVRLAGWELSLAANPVYLPRLAENESRDLLTDEWRWTLGVARGR